MKRILVTGAKGQLGSSLKEAAEQQDVFAFTFLDLEDLDLTREAEVRSYFEKETVAYIINCAAYTDVDKAETHHDEAFAINAEVPRLLGEICQEKSVRLIQMSTDYIYNGKVSSPHKEDEEPAPLSVYAQSKLEGEKFLWKNSGAMIIRTSWLYGAYGRNFLKTILRLADEKEELQVVHDQVGTPTYSGDLAKALLHVISKSEANSFIPGIYNYSNEGICSWYDFAAEIILQSAKKCRVTPIATRQFPQVAVRPTYSVMDKSKIRDTFSLKIPAWQESLKVALHNLRKNQEI
jgi:dTDP-4-dehydrorhamnose reductase